MPRCARCSAEIPAGRTLCPRCEDFFRRLNLSPATLTPSPSQPTS